jgi:membrane-associated protease RseP (regulator of RpoE activity)
MMFTLAVLALIVSVGLHEAGHLTIFRMCGMKVKKVAVGFGPRLLWFTDRKGTQWSLRLLLLGGYTEPEKGSIDRLNPAGQALVFSAGPIVNALLGSLAFTLYTVWPVYPLLWFGYVNATLTILNLLPLPPLDGGRIFLAWLEKRKGRQWLNERKDAFFGFGFLAYIGVLGIIIGSGWQMVPVENKPSHCVMVKDHGHWCQMEEKKK